MLKSLRQRVIKSLWQHHRDHSLQVKKIATALTKKNIENLFLDHFAIIDLPGPNTGISHLSAIFSAIGYREKGRDYLADKQNDFLWMAECDSNDRVASDVLPQIVVADFRLDEMPSEIKKIITKYAHQAPSSPLNQIQKLAQRVVEQDIHAEQQLHDMLINYFQGRDWPLPTHNEFCAVQEFNELLAWVLIFGRRPNHFSLSVHLFNHFANLAEFHQFIEEDVQLPLNREGGIIKGGKTSGIAQGSTIGIPHIVKLADGNIELPAEFVEFVWRYPRMRGHQPLLWQDYFTDFVAQHADRVIESLYEDMKV